MPDTTDLMRSYGRAAVLSIVLLAVTGCITPTEPTVAPTVPSVVCYADPAGTIVCRQSPTVPPNMPPCSAANTYPCWR